MRDLLLEHGRHQVGHGPHALADLRMAGKSALKTDIDIPVLVGANPGGLFHVALADHRTGFHRGVDFIAGAVEEASVDEDDAFLGGTYCFLQVHRGAAFLIHDPHLDGVRLHTEQHLDPSKQLGSECYLFRTVHFRLDHIHGSGAGIHMAAVWSYIMERSQRGNRRIHNAFGNLIALLVEDGRIGHQMADIAHQHQRASRYRQRLAVLACILPVGIEFARNRLAALLECIFEIAIHQAEPVAIDDNLVFRIDSSNGILAILDRGQSRFQQDIGNMCGICLANRMIGIDDDLDMQAILHKKNCGRRSRVAAITGKLCLHP